MSIGTFMLIKNEQNWIGAHLAMTLPFVDQMVFLDGNSTDGTLEILRYYKRKYPEVLTLVEDADPKDLEGDYVRLFNIALGLVRTDWAFFLHPDMIVENPKQLREFAKHDGVAASCAMRSFAGEPDGQLYEIIEGRGTRWKNIYRKNNPDLGAHYFGHYGATNEDVYFSEITGSEHHFYGEDFGRYPYEVIDSGIKVLHFSDVRTYVRRLGRMKKCLENQGVPKDRIDEIAANHPRVTLKDGPNFKFVPAQYPPDFLAAKNFMPLEEKCPA